MSNSIGMLTPEGGKELVAVGLTKVSWKLKVLAPLPALTTTVEALPMGVVIVTGAPTGDVEVQLTLVGVMVQVVGLVSLESSKTTAEPVLVRIVSILSKP